MNDRFDLRTTHNDVRFRYAKGKSSYEGNEIHPYHEILFITDGGGRFKSEHFDMLLTEATLLIIPKGTFHRHDVADQDNYTRLVLNFPDIEEINGSSLFSDKQVKVNTELSSDSRYLIERICRALESDESERQKLNLLYGGFLMLLSDLEACSDNLTLPGADDDRGFIARYVKYVDDNYLSDIKIEDMARDMNVSVSTLFLHFKKHLGVSVYKYVSEKRLIHAHELLSKGKLPTKIYSECGYNDYVTFYKAYIKMFGHSPSAR